MPNCFAQQSRRQCSLPPPPVLKTPQNNQLHILSGLPDPSNISSGQSNTMKLGLATLVCFLSCVWWSDGAPPTCYSRALGLGKETMSLLNKIHTYHRTKACAEVLPTIFIDIHNACITAKLRDILYVVLNHPDQQCKERPRIVLLKRKLENLYSIISRICYRDLVFFSDDCEAIDTGHITQSYGEDRLQLLVEER
ncbi:cytokine-like protein 1 [Gadus macrocephalus]|uniref:cytokine-like protein 1 n=1 Tax=Gadus macrocephalus TaxID=80720 RepID=UPI0028CBB913|nr:cytokine-like protein 1 [Gadus macrocephalus]